MSATATPTSLAQPRRSTAVRALFAPDYRAGNEYQELLARHLIQAGVDVDFLTGYRRLLPLARSVPLRDCDLLHLHWPEAYFPLRGICRSMLRRLRFVFDLKLATRQTPLVMTAHNLMPHEHPGSPLARRNMAHAYRRSVAIFVHSAACADELQRIYGVSTARCHVIPHGDLSVTFAQPLPRAEARSKLELGTDPVCLMFGAVEPYKGLEAAIDFWRARRPRARLVVIGKAGHSAYRRQLIERAAGVESIDLRLRWHSNDELGLWLTAADCALFNYRAILTSGAACLARSWGIPILIPDRLSTVDLHEPDQRVLRFDGIDGNFAEKLELSLLIEPDFAAAADWRTQTSWQRMAQITRDVYDSVLSRPSTPANMKMPTSVNDHGV